MKHPTPPKEVVKFLFSQTVSLFGSSLVQHAMIWHITLTTSSGMMMTLATLCGYIPQILISLFAGVWLDRYSRRNMIMLADGAIAVSTLAIALCFLAGLDSPWLLFLGLLIRSAGAGIQTPAVQALLPALVPKEQLLRVNGIHSTLQALMQFLAPAAGGLVLSFFTLEIAFFIDVFTAIVGIGIMCTIFIPTIPSQKVSTSPRSFWTELRAGFAYVAARPLLRYQIPAVFFVALFISPAAFLTPLLVSRSFGNQVHLLTLSQMGFGAGAVLGGLLISRWGGFSKRLYTVLLATGFYGAMMLGIGLSPTYALYMLFNGLIGISMPCYSAPLTTLLQETVEPAMQGRIFSLVHIANACALPLGTLLFGPLADFVPVQRIFLVTGSVVVLFALLSYIKMARTKDASYT